MRVVFLRHGPTEWNALGRIQGHTDIPLSTAGLEKMRGFRLPEEFAQARVFASPLLRARQTAEALDLAAPILDARLMEQNWGQWEGMSRPDIMARHGDDVFRRHGLALAFLPPGGESTKALHDRVADFLKDAAKDGTDAVVVAHLGVLRAAYTLATNWDMATPMPEGLDVSRLLVLEVAVNGTPSLHTKNLEFKSRTP
jgi:broad specificity phosphatase PhoE